MSCDYQQNIIKYLDNELSLNDSQSMDQHLAVCHQCRTIYNNLRLTLSSLAYRVEDHVDAAVKQNIISTIKAGKAGQVTQPSIKEIWAGTKLRSIGLISAFAIAASIMLMLGILHKTENKPPITSYNSFRARGTLPRPEDRFSLWIFRRSPDENQYHRVMDEIHPNDRLAFGYSSELGETHYLMVLAITPKGEVFWFYPSYSILNSNPQSIPIKEGSNDLPDEIWHKFPVGKIRLWAILSDKPYTVSTIENKIKILKQTTKDLTTLEKSLLPKSLQYSWLLKVK